MKCISPVEHCCKIDLWLFPLSTADTRSWNENFPPRVLKIISFSEVKSCQKLQSTAQCEASEGTRKKILFKNFTTCIEKIYSPAHERLDKGQRERKKG